MSKEETPKQCWLKTGVFGNLRNCWGFVVIFVQKENCLSRVEANTFGCQVRTPKYMDTWPRMGSRRFHMVLVRTFVNLSG